MSRQPFELLTRRLGTFWRADTGTVLLRLSLCLRWLSSASYLDLSVIHSLPSSSVFHHVMSTLYALDRVISMGFNPA